MSEQKIKLAEDPASVRWHLDRRVPVVIVVTLMLQAAGSVWWASDMSARVSALESAIVANNQDRERLVRVETTVQSIDLRLARMEDRR